MGTRGELWLPEPAIERIQDFLDAKEAAQTMILSKSWHNVWLNRPNLDFDHDHKYAAHPPGLSQEEYSQLYVQREKRFWEFMDKTLSRYEESNLKIQKLKLSILSSRGSELIVRALKIGATHFTLYLSSCYGFVLPDEVFESVEDLTLIWCSINPRPLVTCSSKLQSLSLCYFVFKNPDPISNILSSCPLIQYLSLQCIELEKPENFIPSDDGDGYYDNYPTNDYGYITKPLMWLTTLVLKRVYFDMLFLGDLSSKFPLLTDLTLIMTLKKHQEEIRFSSTSLERLNFTLKNRHTYTRNDHPYKRQRVALELPSIRKFTYVSSVIPLLSLESDSSGWDSHLCIRRRHKRLTASWFRRLSDLLTELRPSRVSLTLCVRSVTSFNYEAGDIQGFPISEIENLIIDRKELPSLACYALLDVLFHICHPKLITQCVSKCFRVIKKHIELLGHILLNGVVDHEKTVLTRSQFMYGLNDLKEARAQIIGKAAVPLDALLEHLKSAKGKQEVRFHLNWQPTTTRETFYLKMSIHQKIEELDNGQVMNPDNEKGFSSIEHAKHSPYMKEVCRAILENSSSGELVIKIKHLLKLLHDGFPKSDNVDDATNFSCKLDEVFREPCFVNAVRAAIEKGYIMIDFYFGYLSPNNKRSPTERVAHMKADWRFKHTLMSLRSDTTNVNYTIRVLLSIFFGHWSDRGDLRKLDKRMRKNRLGDYLEKWRKMLGL